jgi:uncharacterized protein
VKVVLDTNVVLSGLILPESVPGRIVRAWRAAQFELVLSEPMLDEIGRVLAYSKIERRLKWDQETISRFLLLLQFKANVVDISSATVAVPRDPQDVPVLATLVAGGADFLVTGDKDLLTLGHDYPIVTPAEFASRL